MMDDKNLWNELKKTCIPLRERNDLPFPVKRVKVYPRHDTNEYILDLHGYTVNDAYDKVKNFIENAKLLKLDCVTIITGKSGIIRKEFPIWLEPISGIKNIVLRKGGGAFNVFFKKSQ